MKNINLKSVPSGEIKTFKLVINVKQLKIQFKQAANKLAGFRVQLTDKLHRNPKDPLWFCKSIDVSVWTVFIMVSHYSKNRILNFLRTSDHNVTFCLASGQTVFYNMTALF